MSLLKRIKNESLQARKVGDKLRASLLITLLSEAQAIGKNDGDRESTDAEVIAVIKKFYKNAEASGIQVMTAQRPGFIDEFGKIKAELDILEDYLPKQLSEDNVITVIKSLRDPKNKIVENVDMKYIMSYFKHMFPGQYDGAMVAKHAK